MRHLRIGFFATLLTLAFGLVQAPAQGQPSEDDYALGKELAIAGFDSYKAGSYEDALQSFTKASELYPTGQVLRMLGYTLLALERWVEAADALGNALTAELKPLPEELLGEVRTNLEKANSHISTVNIQTDVDGAIVVIDGGDAEPLPIESRRLAEGRHSFQGSAEGHDDVEQEVELAGGESTTVTLNFQSESPPPSSLPPVAPPPKSEKASSGGPGVLYTLGMATGGAGLLMAGIGVATLVSGSALDASVDDRETLYNTRYSSGCPVEEYALCQSDAAAINNQADRAAAMQTAGVVLTITGGVFLAGGIVMMAVAPDSAPDQGDSQGASVACGPYGLAGVGCVGRF